MKSFKEALDQDLQRAGLDRKALAEALHISVQAVGKWVAASSVPSGRREEVAKLLGADARVLNEDLLMEMEPRTRRVSTPVRDNFIGMSRQVHERLHLASLLGPKRAGCVDRLVRFGASSRRFDYLSSRVCLEIVRIRDFPLREPNGPTWNRFPVSARLSLLSLALLKEIWPSEAGESVERTVVLMVEQTPLSPQEVSRFTAEAAVLGISVLMLGSMREVAAYIEDLEKSSPPQISSSSDDLAFSSDPDDPWDEAE